MRAIIGTADLLGMTKRILAFAHCERSPNIRPSFVQPGENEHDERTNARTERSSCRHRFIGACVVAVTALGGAPSLASGSPGPYRIVRLDGPFDPQGLLCFGRSRALGINDDGAVVGTATFPGVPFVSNVGAENPFLWIPRPLYQLSGNGGLIRLPPFGDSTVSASGEATDINAAGDIVGVADSPGTAAGTDRAFLVSLDGVYAAGAGVMQDLGVLGVDSFGAEFSRAEAVSDRYVLGPTGPPALVVAGRSSTASAPCDGFTDSGTGFVWTPQAGLAARTGSGVLPCGWVLGVSPQAANPSGPRATAGYIRKAVTGVPTCNVTPFERPARWGATSSLTIYPEDAPGIDGYEGIAYDIRRIGTAEVAVGFIREDVSSCPEYAWRWDTEVGLPTVSAPLAADPVNPTDSTRAFAVSENGEIVGENTDANRGMIWEANGTAHRLDAVVDFTTAPVVTSILTASDINSNGWIVGTASAEDICFNSMGIPYETGVLLIPPNPCQGDVDWDGDVDAVDLAMIQTAPGGPCGEVWDACLEDVNVDGVVDGRDLTTVLRFLKSGGCGGETLDAALVETWRAAGGDQFLAENPESSSDVVTEAYVPGDQAATFFNLLELLGGDA